MRGDGGLDVLPARIRRALRKLRVELGCFLLALRLLRACLGEHDLSVWWTLREGAVRKQCGPNCYREAQSQVVRSVSHTVSPLHGATAAIFILKIVGDALATAEKQDPRAPSALSNCYHPTFPG